MIVVDVETTGVDSRLCSLLSVGALDFDNPENQFYMECRAFDGAHVEKEALEISGFTDAEIFSNDQAPISNDQQATVNHDTPSPASADASAGRHSPPLKRGRGKVTDKELVLAFLEWLKTCKEWTLAGQNPSFDCSFLEETAHRYHINWPLAHRTIDLHTLAYTEFMRAGKEIPRTNNHSALNLDRILEHVGLPTRTKKHNALEDAKLEAEAFSRLLYRKGLLREFGHLPLVGN
jgi:DNA polymerase III epsilon subunit-like protein